MMQDQLNFGQQAGAAGCAPPTCPVTHSTDAQKLCVVDGFEIWRCAQSATDFVWPMPSDQELKDYYDRAAYFEGGEHGGYTDYDVQTEPSLQMVTELLNRFPESNGTLSVLDIGCSYGSHLRLAADRNWQCFGIELSEHARKMAKERHGDLMTIVGSAEELPMRQYDLVIMLEVIEHLNDPYPLFATLFEKGAIGPDTLMVITTPNARSNDAIANPPEWEFRHPPSHLVFYSAQTLKTLMDSLGFKDVFVRGLVDMPAKQTYRYDDETSLLNDELDCSMGICAEGIGTGNLTLQAANSAAKDTQLAERNAADSGNMLTQDERAHDLALQGRELVMRERAEIIKRRDEVIRERMVELINTRAWVSEMEKAKQWQESEHAAVVDTLTKRDQELAESRAWATTLNEGKEWLAGQNSALEEQLTERLQVLNETEKRLDTIFRSRAWRILKKLKLAPEI